MTTEVDTSLSGARRPDFRAAPSLACDLSWVLSVAANPATVKDGQRRAGVFEGREELAQRVRDFWGDDGPNDTCFTEMQALAHHAGAITETSAAALWDALNSAVSSVPLDLGLESEHPDDRIRFLHRLERLQNSPDLMRRYVALLQEVWEPLDAEWRAALPLLVETSAHTLTQLHAGKPFPDLLAVTCETYQARLPLISSMVDNGHTLLVVPCYFFGCSLYLEFPGMTLIGTDVEEHGAMARARTEVVARRLKTVADPTRLALLHFLSARPSSVSDLATSFGLAQPTVSMHVKLLREAGMVRAERTGGRLELRADPDAVDSLLSDLRGVVTQPTAAAAPAHV